MDWKYIAGFFDGEGSITQTQGRHRLYITQANLEVLELIKAFVGYGKVSPITKRKNHWKDAWVYFIGDMHQVQQFLEGILPYLIVKKDKAKNAIVEIRLRIDRIDKAQELKTRKMQQAVALRQQGLTYRAIGQILKTDWGYVRHLIKGTK